AYRHHHRPRHCGSDRNCDRPDDRDQCYSNRVDAESGDDLVWPDPRDGYRLSACFHRAGRSRRSRNRADPMTTPVIEAANVSKVYGSGPARVEALRDVNLTVRTGELTVLIGPSGSGKTTLLSILGCMLAPSDGVARVCGDSIV